MEKNRKLALALLEADTEAKVIDFIARGRLLGGLERLANVRGHRWQFCDYWKPAGSSRSGFGREACELSRRPALE